jgi:hypothetical protein
MPALPSIFSVQVAFEPLPPQLMHALRQIEVETAIGQASILRLHFDLSRTFVGDLDVLAFDVFLPLSPISIRLSSLFGIPQCLINGYVTNTDLSAQNQPGQSTFEVVAIDALGATMSHIQQPWAWTNLPDSAIAQAIFTRYGMLPVVAPTPPTRTMNDTTTIQRVHDAAFLIQLANRHCYEVYVQPDPVTGRDIGHFHPPQTLVPPQGILSVDFGTQTNLTHFHPSYDALRPTSVLTAASDPFTRAVVHISGRMSIDPPMGKEPTLARILPPPIERMYCTDAANPAEMQAQALARATCSSRIIRATGEVDGIKYARPLLAGLPVLVRGAGRQHSGLYYVTSVTHRISRDDYVQSFSAWRNAVGLTGAEVFTDPLAGVA